MVELLGTYDSHVTVLEKHRQGHIEEFRLGHGDTSIGALLWDGNARHVHVVDFDVYKDVVVACGSSEP